MREPSSKYVLNKLMKAYERAMTNTTNISNDVLANMSYGQMYVKHNMETLEKRTPTNQQPTNNQRTSTNQAYDEQDEQRDGAIEIVPPVALRHERKPCCKRYQIKYHIERG